MSCFYCGKRVSLVRKRTDPDFCSEEHRQKYNARARRGLDRLLEAEEGATVNRRLNEGFPLRPSVFPQRGSPLESLVNRHPDPGHEFAAARLRLPLTTATLRVHFPSPGRIAVPAVRGLWACSQASLEFLSWKPEPGPRPAIPGCRPSVRTNLRSASMQPAAPERISRDVARRPHCCAAPDVAGSRPMLVYPDPPAAAAPLSVYSPMTLVQTPRPVSLPTALHRSNGIGTAPLRLMLATTSPRLFHVTPPQFGLIPNRWRKPMPGGRGFKPFRTYVAIHPAPLSILATTVSGQGSLRMCMPSLERSESCRGSVWQRMYTWETNDALRPPAFPLPPAEAAAERSVVAPAPHVPLGRVWASTIASRVHLALDSMPPGPPGIARVAPVAFHPAARILRAHEHLADAAPLARDEDRLLQAAREAPATASTAVRMHQAARVESARWAAGVASYCAVRPPAAAAARRARPEPAQSPIAPQSPGLPHQAELTPSAMPGPAAPGRVAVPRHKPRPLTARLVRVLPEGRARLPETEPLECVLSQPVPRALRIVSMQPAGKDPLTSTVAFPPARSFQRSAARIVYSPARGLRPLPHALEPHSAEDLPERRAQVAGWEACHRFSRAAHAALGSQPVPACWPTSRTPGLRVCAAHRPYPGARERAAAQSLAMPCAWHSPAPAAIEYRGLPLIWDQPIVAMAPTQAGGQQPRTESVALAPTFVFPSRRTLPVRDWGQQATASLDPPQTLHEDFAAGLAHWSGGAADWRQDVAGVRTGSLALYSPSLDFIDYEMEFLGRLGSRGLGWVFRASDPGNYYAVRIAAVKSAATPGFLLERYAVVEGKEQGRIEMPLHTTISKKSPCKVRMRIKGNDFTISINEQPADHFSDDRLPLGGVGFFSDGEDRARLYWVKVSPLDDGQTEESGAGSPSAGGEASFEITMGV